MLRSLSFLPAAGGLRNRRAHKRTVLSAPSSSAPTLAGEGIESVLAARTRPSFATTKPVQKLSRSREEKRGERSAERRNPTIVRRANKWAQCAPLVCVRGGGAPQKTLLAQRLCLRGALAFRRTAAALVRAFDLLTQLQAMLPGMSARRALPARSQAQCRESGNTIGSTLFGPTELIIAPPPEVDRPIVPRGCTRVSTVDHVDHA